MSMNMDIGEAASVVQGEGNMNMNSINSSPMEEIESLCMRCGLNGITRLLLTKIPHFQEIVVMAFECPHCNERNNEVQFVGQLQTRGCCYTLKVLAGDLKVLNRQVVKSDSATIKVPELEFEVPPEAQRGKLTTVEGVLRRAAEDLQALQEERKKVDPQTAEALDAFMKKLNSYASGEAAFTFILDDPAGNSFVENPDAPLPDPLLAMHFYDRTQEEQAALGFVVDNSAEVSRTEGDNAMFEDKSLAEKKHRYIPAGAKNFPHGSVGAQSAFRTIAQGESEAISQSLLKYSAPEEVMTFPATCSACGAKCETRMYVTNIPYFKEVIVMAAVCDICGYKNSELKPGGSVPDKGRRIIVQVAKKEDLDRDVIKSDTASVIVPELELELTPGTMGGLVTTIEGLLLQVNENLKRVHGFSVGDSAVDWTKNKWVEFELRLKKLLEIQEPWTLILDDALANSFIAPGTDVIEDDERLKFEDYERTWDQNEELGLNDLDTSVADVAYEEK